MKLKDDVFIHFTLKKYLPSIEKFNGLMKSPPGIQKRGTDALFAVSLKWGWYVPDVQTRGIKGGEVVGIIFKTNDMPKYGYPEEVVWNGDLKFDGKIKVVSLAQGISLLKQKKEIEIDEDTVVSYVR